MRAKVAGGAPLWALSGDVVKEFEELIPQNVRSSGHEVPMPLSEVFGVFRPPVPHPLSDEDMQAAIEANRILFERHPIDDLPRRSAGRPRGRGRGLNIGRGRGGSRGGRRWSRAPQTAGGSSPAQSPAEVVVDPFSTSACSDPSGHAVAAVRVASSSDAGAVPIRQVPPDGLCLFYVCAAARDYADWSSQERSEQGCARGRERQRFEHAAALALREEVLDRMAECALMCQTLGEDAGSMMLTDRITTLRSGDLPNEFDFPHMAHVMGSKWSP